MSRVDNLCQEMDERLKLGERIPESEHQLSRKIAKPTPSPPKSQHSKAIDMTPSLPPHMQSARLHTAEEIVKEMARTPLFMTSLEDADGADDENVELEAIRALKYEGTPAEVALGLKENGNELVKVKRWKDAKDLYTQALGVLHKSQHEPTTAATSPNPQGANLEQANTQQEKSIQEACYINRALCNLELKNYRSTTVDCAATLRLNPSNIKAFYRSALALFALDKLSEALDASTRGKSLVPSNTAFPTLISKIQTRSAALAAIEEARAQATSQRQKEEETLSTALRARNIIIRNSPSPPSLEDATVHLSPDPLSPTSTLVFPLLLLYPLHAQSDFIKACPETSSMAEHLKYIFPLPWDEASEYRLGNVELYMETGFGAEEGKEKERARLIKVGRKMTILEILSGGKVVVWDGLVRVNVLLKGKAAGWIEEVKKRKGR